MLSFLFNVLIGVIQGFSELIGNMSNNKGAGLLIVVFLLCAFLVYNDLACPAGSAGCTSIVRGVFGSQGEGFVRAGTQFAVMDQETFLKGVSFTRVQKSSPGFFTPLGGTDYLYTYADVRDLIESHGPTHLVWKAFDGAYYSRGLPIEVPVPIMGMDAGATAGMTPEELKPYTLVDFGLTPVAPYIMWNENASSSRTWFDGNVSALPMCNDTQFMMPETASDIFHEGSWSSLDYQPVLLVGTAPLSWVSTCYILKYEPTGERVYCAQAAKILGTDYPCGANSVIESAGLPDIGATYSGGVLSPLLTLDGMFTGITRAFDTAVALVNPSWAVFYPTYSTSKDTFIFFAFLAVILFILSVLWSIYRH